MKCRNLEDFGRIFDFLRSVLKTSKDYYDATTALLADLANQHVRYAEFRLGVGDCVRAGVGVDDCLDSVCTAIADVESSLGIHARAILGFSRSRAASDAALTVAAARLFRDRGVGGIDVYGHELLSAPETYRKLAALMAKDPMPLTIHVGERRGPESVWEALTLLRPQRLGHATRAIEDQSLVDEIAKRRLHVEMSVSSNIAMGVVQSAENHPLQRFKDSGIQVSLSTDDPAIFGNSMNSEYRLVRDTFSFTDSDFRSCYLDAIDAAFCDATLKEALRSCWTGASDVPSRTGVVDRKDD
jgi:adenosine deaminase